MSLGIPGQIAEICDRGPHTDLVILGGIRKELCLTYTPEARVGDYVIDYVIVHAGFAIGVLEANEAQRTLAYCNQIAAEEKTAKWQTPPLFISISTARLLGLASAAITRECAETRLSTAAVAVVDVAP